MEKASKAVWAALKRLAGEEKPLDLLAAIWPLAVGSRLAEHTEPVAWEKGNLEIAVDDRDWQKQLEQMPEDIAKQVNKWWGSKVVTRVTFIRARARRAAAPSHKGKAASGEKPASEAEIRAAMRVLEKPLQTITDPEVRALIKRVAQKYMGSKEKK